MTTLDFYEKRPDAAVARRAQDSLARRFDRQWGGFGGAPKFPTPSNLCLCLEMAEDHPEAGEMLSATLDQMAAVHGVGRAKLAQYGDDFLEVIRRHLET